MIECIICGTVYKPEATRWLCIGCGWKESCCEGEACPAPGVASEGPNVPRGTSGGEP